MGTQIKCLNHADVVPHGPYKGQTVQWVLDNDPDELTAYTQDNLEPKYNINSEVLHDAYWKTQDRLGWDEFIKLWRGA
jgi:hypothetical protein